MPNWDIRPLTTREVAVLDLLMLGKSNKEIAAELGVTLSCAKFHVANVFQKLCVHSRIELVLKQSGGASIAPSPTGNVEEKERLEA